MRGEQAGWRWWGSLGLIWLACLALQRLWLLIHPAYLSWDQADYLNSAVDHGRALGCLARPGWTGWGGLLNLSPKIPPLASLVNGCVIAVSGEAPDQARLALMVWLAGLLWVIACWGRQLIGPRFGLLGAALVALSPGIWQVNLRYSLDLPLAAITALALWLLGRWHRSAAPGIPLTLAASSAVAAAILVKQSALLFVAVPLLAATASAIGNRSKRLLLLLAVAVGLAWVLPWLHHNWITTLGGTNRAVFESATAEGDPDLLSAAGLSWYALRLPGQAGLISSLGGALGLVLLQRRRRGGDVGALGSDWRWLLICAAGGLLLLTLSPNKDERYLAPLLPPVLLLLARGWLELGRQQRLVAWIGGALMLVELPASLTAQQRPISAPPIAAALAPLRQIGTSPPRTVVVVPDERELNEHSVTTAGRSGGDMIVGRHLRAREPKDRQLLRERADWILLGSSPRRRRLQDNLRLSRELEASGTFERLSRVGWNNGRDWLELWGRRSAPARSFANDFPTLAEAAGSGPSGLVQLMERIGPEHQLDGHQLYQQQVRWRAMQRLATNANDRQALWSLAFLAVLNNQKSEAAGLFGQLSGLEPANPWPGTYRSVVLLADWNSCGAADVANAQLQRPLEAVPPLLGLRDLAAGLCFRPWRLAVAAESVPAAVRWAKTSLAPTKP
jgi:4-amino-4-deoxy-L-arabinose transferase-like glycosyltransferase